MKEKEEGQEQKIMDRRQCDNGFSSVYARNSLRKYDGGVRLYREEVLRLMRGAALASRELRSVKRRDTAGGVLARGISRAG